MSKKNKNNVNVGSNDFSSKFEKQYKEIVSDIEDIQYKIYQADKKKAKKQKKKMKNKKAVEFYNPRSKKARIKAANKITKGNFFKSLKKILSGDFINDLLPIIKTISRLIMTLVLSILSLDIVKENISKKSLERIDVLMNLCKGVA